MSSYSAVCDPGDNHAFCSIYLQYAHSFLNEYKFSCYYCHDLETHVFYNKHILCDYFLSQKEYIIDEINIKIDVIYFSNQTVVGTSCCATKNNIFVIGGIGFISRT